MTNPSFVPLISLAAPFLLWPVEIILPYPYIVEEVGKLLLVLLVVRSSPKSQQLWLILIAGLLFAFSETVFYLFNIFLVGNLGTIGHRLILTIPLHTLTILLIWSFAKRREWLIIPGTALAVGLHYIFNFLAAF